MISMQENDEIFKGGLEEHPKSRIVFGNTVMLFWFVLGAIACWYFYPVLGVVYFIVAFIMVYIVLRKVVCVNCYYYDKWCGLGWGKLAAAMFKKGKIEDFPKSIGVKLAPATYGVLMIVPMILLIVSIIQLFSWYKVCVLVLLLLVSFYSGGISRKFSCSQCKMNVICPGSAIKKEKNIK
jgi:hypothetical protein